MDKILLFIPGYNCEKQVIRVLHQLDSRILPYLTQVIMVNNRSTDGTEQAVRTFVKSYPQVNLRILRNRDNYNLGGSHKIAFQYALKNDFDYVIVLHGDDQGDIHDLLPVLENKEYLQYDCCLGARFQKGSILKGYSTFRTFGNRVFNFIFSLALWQKVYDLGSGLNLYSVKMLQEKFYMKFPDRLTFNYCMIMAANYYGHQIHFFPITWREDDQASNVKMASQAFNVLAMLTKYFFLRNKFLSSDLRLIQVENYTADDVTDLVEG